MKKVSILKVFLTGMTQPHLEPFPIPLIKENHDGTSEKDFVKLKLCRDPTSPTPDLYEFRISLLDNGKPEEFLLLVCKFNKTLASPGMLEAGAKYQYLCNLVRRKLLHRFDSLYDEVESAETLNADSIIRGYPSNFPL